MKLPLMIVSICIVSAGLGCHRPGKRACCCTTKPTPSTQPVSGLTVPPPPATLPAVPILYTLELTPGDGETTRPAVAWSVTVPTGGWTVTTDRVDTDQPDGVVRVYLTLQRPGPGQMVTQALQTFEDSHDLGEQAEAELLVRHAIRGDESSLEPAHQAVKRVGKAS